MVSSTPRVRSRGVLSDLATLSAPLSSSKWTRSVKVPPISLASRPTACSFPLRGRRLFTAPGGGQTGSPAAADKPPGAAHLLRRRRGRRPRAARLPGGRLLRRAARDLRRPHGHRPGAAALRVGAGEPETGGGDGSIRPWAAALRRVAGHAASVGRGGRFRHQAAPHAGLHRSPTGGRNGGDPACSAGCSALVSRRRPKRTRPRRKPVPPRPRRAHRSRRGRASCARSAPARCRCR